MTSSWPFILQLKHHFWCYHRLCFGVAFSRKYYIKICCSWKKECRILGELFISNKREYSRIFETLSRNINFFFFFLFSFFFFLHWHYCLLWVLTCLTMSFYFFLSATNSSHSQHLKISFYFLFPTFPGSSPSSRPFQFLSEDLFGHPILLHSL